MGNGAPMGDELLKIPERDNNYRLIQCVPMKLIQVMATRRAHIVGAGVGVALLLHTQSIEERRLLDID